MIALLFEIIIVTILYLTGKSKYNSEVTLASGRSKLCKALPVGFQITKLVNRGRLNHYILIYEKRLEGKIREISGGDRCHTFVEIHLAEKLTVLIFTVIFLTFVGTQIKVDTTYILFSIGLVCVLFYLWDRKLDEQIRKRRRDIQIGLPEFLNKLILLVNAGMTVQGALQKIVKENRKEGPLYHELAIAVTAIDSGEPETAALEEFAKRCRVQEVTMFAAALIQNLRKGNDQLIPILRLQADICWENRKNMAKKLGEEASTKLLFPMIIIFVAILIMIMTPAVLQLQQM